MLDKLVQEDRERLVKAAQRLMNEKGLLDHIHLHLQLTAFMSFAASKPDEPEAREVQYHKLMAIEEVFSAIERLAQPEDTENGTE